MKQNLGFGIWNGKEEREQKGRDLGEVCFVGLVLLTTELRNGEERTVTNYNGRRLIYIWTRAKNSTF